MVILLTCACTIPPRICGIILGFFLTSPQHFIPCRYILVNLYKQVLRPDSTTAKSFARNCVCEMRMVAHERFYWILPQFSLSQWVELTSIHWRSDIFSREILFTLMTHAYNYFARKLSQFAKKYRPWDQTFTLTQSLDYDGDVFDKCFPNIWKLKHVALGSVTSSARRM